MTMLLDIDVISLKRIFRVHALQAVDTYLDHVRVVDGAVLVDDFPLCLSTGRVKEGTLNHYTTHCDVSE
jgi:hypothetical protein